MKQLVLIHGAIGGADQLVPLRNLLLEDFEVHLLEFEGHGKSASNDDPFTIESFRSQLRIIMEQINEPVHIFGYSMGGFVALLEAAHGNDQIHSIITLGTKMKWSPEIALQESKHLNPQKIKEKVPQFAAALEKRHGEWWEKVLNRTVDFMKLLGEQQPIEPDLMAKITSPVQLCLADQDMMVSEEETQEVEGWIKSSTLRRIENSKHPIEQVDLTALASTIRSFILSND